MILPCPFCPSTEQEINPPTVNFYKSPKYHNPHYTVACNVCGCEPNFYVETEKEAINKWNFRYELKGNQISFLTFNIAKNLIVNVIESIEFSQFPKVNYEIKE